MGRLSAGQVLMTNLFSSKAVVEVNGCPVSTGREDAGTPACKLRGFLSSVPHHLQSEIERHQQPSPRQDTWESKNVASLPSELFQDSADVGSRHHIAS